MKMKRYELISDEYRNTIDLRDYETMIRKVIGELRPKATVIVEKNFFLVGPSPDHGFSVAMGQILSKIENMGNYCAMVPRLFTGTEVSGDLAELCKNGGRRKRGRPKKVAG